ncbi:MAG: 30S ribosomal protein S3ae, partial [Asgard group archaeon]|nr:30S ribosomal protein S3ae [Asgard group archaeon]
RDKRVVDKFSLKSWYVIHTPEMFGTKPITETPAADPEMVVGRTITQSVMDVTGDYKKIHVKLTFKVNDVKGENAYTKFKGHEYTRDYIRSMIRRRRTRIDGIFNIITKDKAKIRISIIALTPFRCKASHEKGIRKIMQDLSKKRAKRQTYEKFVNDLISGRLATAIYKKARKVHPIQNVDVWKSLVVNYPKITAEEKEETKEKPKEKPKEEAQAEA